MDGKIALVEAGANKFIVDVADPWRRITARTRIGTIRPEETIAAAIHGLQQQAGGDSAVVVASFGRLDLNPALPS